jgi:hypothetical protein
MILRNALPLNKPFSTHGSKRLQLLMTALKLLKYDCNEGQQRNKQQSLQHLLPNTPDPMAIANRFFL